MIVSICKGINSFHIQTLESFEKQFQSAEPYKNSHYWVHSSISQDVCQAKRFRRGWEIEQHKKEELASFDQTREAHGCD